MKDITTSIVVPPYLFDWLVNKYGNPLKFPARSPHNDLLHALVAVAQLKKTPGDEERKRGMAINVVLNTFRWVCFTTSSPVRWPSTRRTTAHLRFRFQKLRKWDLRPTMFLLISTHRQWRVCYQWFSQTIITNAPPRMTTSKIDQFVMISDGTFWLKIILKAIGTEISISSCNVVDFIWK